MTSCLFLSDSDIERVTGDSPRSKILWILFIISHVQILERLQSFLINLFDSYHITYLSGTFLLIKKCIIW
jgi:hypothetical protein